MEECIRHPYFWNAERRLGFIILVSDRWESESRDPPSKLHSFLERDGNSEWGTLIDEELVDVGKFKKYDTSSLRDLLRLIRNKVSF